MTILTTLRTRMSQRAAFARTKWEIENMPLDVALDLDIFREDARQIARKAIYG